MTAASAGRYLLRAGRYLPVRACCPRPIRTACGRRCTIHMQWVVTRAAPTRGRQGTDRGGQEPSAS
eukprot:5527934-Alexandrium_andersonii.AAC.1